MRVPRYQCFSHQMNNWQTWQLKNQNPGGRFGATSYLDSNANPAHLPQKRAKWAELAVLFGW